MGVSSLLKVKVKADMTLALLFWFNTVMLENSAPRDILTINVVIAALFSLTLKPYPSTISAVNKLVTRVEAGFYTSCTLKETDEGFI
jgi:hypothetical protein